MKPNDPGRAAPARSLRLSMLALCVLLTGCGRSDVGSASAPPTPKVAATQLEQAFTSAKSEVKDEAAAASKAIRDANYEQAVQSLYSIKSRANLTFEQGMAVYNSEMALEAALLSRASAGDAKARQTYELLKKSKRN